MRFALPILPLLPLLALVCSCSTSSQIAGNEPPTPRAVTRAQVDAMTDPAAAVPPPPVEEKKGWMPKLPKLPPLPKLAILGGKKDEAPVEPPPAPEKPKPKQKKPEQVALEAALGAPEPEPEPEKKPGFLSRAAGALPFVGEDEEELGPPPRLPDMTKQRPTLPDVPREQRVRARSKDLKGLEMLVALDPASPSAGKDRRIAVNIVLYNSGKKSVSLRFHTAQTRDIVIRNQGNQIVTRWSEDYTFEQTMTTLIINPQDRVEFKETISTRDLVAGRPYRLDVGVYGVRELTLGIPLQVRP
jgi:hypothetical protein